MAEADLLIDVSRLIWRFWRGGLPTGIDRVCLAYVEHFRDRGQAVVHRRGRFTVLTPSHSRLLFDIFSRGSKSFRRDFIRLAPRAFAAGRRRPPRDGLLYINVGHTGLDEPSVGEWITENRLRAVFLIHDLIPLLYPEYCRAGEHAKHQRRMEIVLASAHGLIGNSQATINEVARCAAEHGLPMPPAIAASIAGPPVPRGVVPRKFERPHFIIVGTIEARKNHALLLHVWKRLVARLGDQVPLLVIVGQRGWEASLPVAMLDRAADLKGHVLEFGTCGDEELASLIAGARALLMPSFAEGFGLPIAEALQLGTPVIASDLAVFREFAGKIPTYLDPLDGLGWQNAIESFIGDPQDRQRQLAALGGYSAPGWSEHFASVEQWIEALPQ
ncbi:MAG: glycosyltransferase family 4 protein [Sphingomicrobium sp.]